MIHKPDTLKRLVAFILAAALALLVIAPDPVRAANNGDSWAIYLYLCGSDLETDAAQATRDILEIISVELPKDVKVVIQIGGALYWWIDIFDPNTMYRLMYDNVDLYITEEADSVNMGDPDSLADFLRYCEENFPADHKALIFWDHGGGSGTGVCFDELYDFDYLTLTELREAFADVYGEPEAPAPVFDIIGFDACLMATVDVAAACYGYGRYMVASQEVEPGCGWSYDSILEKLTEDSQSDPLDLACWICDSYYYACNELELAEKITLSVIDLEKLPDVEQALDDLSLDGLLSALAGDPSEFFAEYGRGAGNAERYANGYFEMVDLIGLVRENLELFPDAGEALIQAVADSVVYEVSGPYRAGSHGLSAYFPYELDFDLFVNFFNSSASPGYAYLYELLVMGLLTDASAEYFWELASELSDAEKAEIARLLGIEATFEDTSIYGLEDAPVQLFNVFGAAYALLRVDPESAAKLREVTLMMYAITDKNTMLYLGDIADSSYDWETGMFLQRFYGDWGAIDGNFVWTEVESVTDDYILYTVPIFLNDRQCDLTVAKILRDGSYRILTATPFDNGVNIPSKEQFLLTPGDEVVTIFVSVEDGVTAASGYDEFTVTEDTVFTPMPVPDGYYGFLFYMTDYMGNTYSTRPVIAEFIGGSMSMYYQFN